MALEDTLYPLLRLYEGAPQPLRHLTGRLYRALPDRLRLGSAHATFRAEAAASETWTTDQITRYQINALRDSLLAADQCPLYRQRFRQAGVKPSDFDSLDQLRSYPLLTKHDLQHSGTALQNPDFPSSQHLRTTTGGSTGTPVALALHKGVTRSKEHAYLQAQWSRFGYQPGHRVAVLRGHAIPHADHGAIHRLDTTRGWLILSSSHLTPDRLPDYLDALTRYSPRHLHAYPSAALQLMRLLQQCGQSWSLPLTSLLCGSEKLTPDEQSSLTHFFGAPVCHWYGHSERVVLAGQHIGCTDLTFWPGYGFAELGTADEDGFSEVIGTSFHNPVMPLIRYRTGDRVRALPTRDHFTVQEVAGRTHDFLVSRSGRRISLTTLNRHDDLFTAALAVQYVQTAPGCVTLRVQPGPHWNATHAAKITRVLTAVLGEGFHLTIDTTSLLQRSPRGKHLPLVHTFAP